MLCAVLLIVLLCTSRHYDALSVSIDRNIGLWVENEEEMDCLSKCKKQLTKCLGGVGGELQNSQKRMMCRQQQSLCEQNNCGAYTCAEKCEIKLASCLGSTQDESGDVQSLTVCMQSRHMCKLFCYFRQRSEKQFQKTRKKSDKINT